MNIEENKYEEEIVNLEFPWTIDPHICVSNDWENFDKQILDFRLTLAKDNQDKLTERFNEIISSVNEDIKKSELSKSDEISKKAPKLKFADVKQPERCNQKLSEQHKETSNDLKRNKNKDTFKSIFFKSKHSKLCDINRCSLVFKDATDTVEYFHKLKKQLNKSQDFKIANIKNMFKNKKLDENDYKDIKLILCFKVGKFWEFLEVQLIQEVILNFKKAEHKIQDFSRLNWDEL